ncbi:MAG: 2,3-bisphosphoglycerate-independent phosphoglycerate mutase [Eggerthellaceae bacterium]|nr:2,3-bisphosphoglycerate-independent phosphoglycerate mutase [Eggerthellaceae bacterium]
MKKAFDKPPVCLIIMDGFGLDEPSAKNAISLATKPFLDDLFEHRPFIQLQASGEAVGLPEGQMGNSEVGHLNIGAGRVVYQELTRINKACRDGSLAANEVLIRAYENASKNGSVLHLMGLLSDGGVHSNNEHLYALMRLACDMELPEVFVHCLMDGRDVPPKSGLDYICELMDVMGELESEKTHFVLASIQGRYYGMDRDTRWDRIQKGYEALVCASPYESLDPREVMERSYASGVTDEFVIPVALQDRGMIDGDSVIFFNFRPDRARQITRSITEPDFGFFDRVRVAKVDFVCLTEYDPTIKAPVAFAKEFPQNVLADVLSDAGLTQYHIAETEKYAHVTFFLNGGVEAPKEGEERKLIASPHVATYDLQPEMSEPEVAATLAQAIRDDVADVYIVNFANCDMVGHTGIIPAAVKAVEAVDAGVALVCEAIAAKGGTVLLTADHGNADCMVAEDGSPHTAHTTAPVPCVIIDYSDHAFTFGATGGALCDLAPTILDMLEMKQPTEMTGKSLLA